MTELLYFAIAKLHYNEEYALNCPISRLFLLLMEHIEQNTAQEDKKIVDLFTQELIDKIKTKINKPKPYVYIPDYNPLIGIR